MAARARRFYVWPVDDLTSRARPRPIAEGVLWTDDAVSVHLMGCTGWHVIYAHGGIDMILGGMGLMGPCDIEWLDGEHG